MVVAFIGFVFRKLAEVTPFADIPSQMYDVGYPALIMWL
jgi:hypothetical protein